jgi:hypothetical protein
MPSDPVPGLHVYVHLIHENNPDPLDPTIMVSAQVVIQIANLLKTAAQTEVTQQAQIANLQNQLNSLIQQEGDLNKPEVQQAIDDAFAAVAAATPGTTTTTTGTAPGATTATGTAGTGTASTAPGTAPTGSTGTATINPQPTTTPTATPAAPQQDTGTTAPGTAVPAGGTPNP